MYVKIDVNSPANDASFTGTVDFELQYTDEATEATKTLGIAKVGDIVERGEYPQTFVGASLNSTLLNLYNSGSLQATGRTFTTESGDYTLGLVIKDICKEYLYNKERYVMVESAKFYSVAMNLNNYFSTGESIGDSGKDFNDGAKLFFKVEPIKFRVMAIDEEKGEMTLWSEAILGSMAFDIYEDSRLWQDSDIREYFNDRFLKDSYLGYAPKQVQIENNVDGEYYENNGTPTQDKLWLPAVSDLVEWYPDLNIEIESGFYDELIKIPSDFALATYTIADSDGKTGIAGLYYLRSIGTYSLFIVVNVGYIDGNGGMGDINNGLCPAFVTDL